MRIETITNPELVRFTSDLHLGDKTMAYKRGFATVEAMNQVIIDRFNSGAEQCTTYILGDLGKDMEAIKALKGNKVVILGNHDKYEVIKANEISSIIVDMMALEIQGTYYHLCHYPLERFFKDNGDNVHLHGHMHGDLDWMDTYNYKRMDVGVDTNSMHPYDIQAVTAKLNKRYEEHMAKLGNAQY